MDEPLNGTSLGTEHAERIGILAIVHVPLCAVLDVQPFLQGLESFFSRALVFIHRLRVHEREVCKWGQVSVAVSLKMVGGALPYSVIFRDSFVFILSHLFWSRVPCLRLQGST